MKTEQDMELPEKLRREARGELMFMNLNDALLMAADRIEALQHTLTDIIDSATEARWDKGA